MKKSLTKLIVSCAAVAAVTTAMAVSASAASYAEGVLTTDIQSKAEVGKQATILVYEANSADTEATADTIKYIDQQAMTADGLWKTINVALEDGKKYVIKMGGEGAEVTSELLGGADVTVGDVDGSGVVDVFDAVAIVDSLLDPVNKALTDDQKLAADAYADGTIDVFDATAIIDFILDSTKTLPVTPNA